MGVLHVLGQMRYFMPKGANVASLAGYLGYEKPTKADLDLYSAEIISAIRARSIQFSYGVSSEEDWWQACAKTVLCMAKKGEWPEAVRRYTYKPLESELMDSGECLWGSLKARGVDT